MPLLSRRTAGAVVGVVALIGCGELLGIEPGHAQAPDASVPGSGDPAPDGGADPTANLPPIGTPDASCGDTTKDAKNCGECGRDCLGGTCERGRCQPYVFTLTAGSAPLVTVTNEGVYWTEYMPQGAGTAVRRCDFGGCQNGIRMLFELADAFYFKLLVQGDLVYALGTEVDVCQRFGCGGSPDTSFPSTAGIGIALTPTTAYYVPNPPIEGVRRCSPPGWTAQAAVFDKGNALATLGGDLFVFDYVAADASQPQSALYRCIGGDCTSAITLATGLQGGSELVASPKGIVWQDLDKVSGVKTLFYTCEPSSCAGGPRLLVTVPGSTQAPVADEKYLYWANVDTSTIERIPWSSSTGKSEVLLNNQGTPGGLAMNDGVLYFSRTMFSDIVRYVPPP
jgi:hypothetical protein